MNSRQIAKILKTVTVSGEKMLLVQSVEPKDTFNRGGINESYQYEWYVNKVIFSLDQESTCRSFGLSAEEFKKWLKEFD